MRTLLVHKIIVRNRTVFIGKQNGILTYKLELLICIVLSKNPFNILFLRSFLPISFWFMHLRSLKYYNSSLPYAFVLNHIFKTVLYLHVITYIYSLQLQLTFVLILMLMLYLLSLACSIYVLVGLFCIHEHLYLYVQS